MLNPRTTPGYANPELGLRACQHTWHFYLGSRDQTQILQLASQCFTNWTVWASPKPLHCLNFSTQKLTIILKVLNFRELFINVLFKKMSHVARDGLKLAMYLRLALAFYVSSFVFLELAWELQTTMIGLEGHLLCGHSLPFGRILGCHQIIYLGQKESHHVEICRLSSLVLSRKS